MKNIKIIAILLIVINSATAQTIKLEFPYFAGQTYEFKIFQGDKQITLKQDTIPKGGKVQLIIPSEYQGYKGMAQWYLTNSKKGGGLDLIINNEDFSIICQDSVPTSQNIVYKGSTENIISKTNYLQRQSLFEKHDAMLAALHAYPKTYKLYPVFDDEYKNIVNSYAAYSKSLSESQLYAARFQQIVGLTLGIGTIITTDEQLRAHNVNNFIVNELDFSALYTSNHWGGIINNWVQLQIMVIKDDKVLLKNILTILHRLPSDKIYTDFVINLTKEISKLGKDYILDTLTQEIKNSKRLLNYEGVLNLYQQDLTGKAPDLNIVTYIGKKEDNILSTTVLKTDALHSKYTLLLFYKSGCGPCEETILGLKKNYKILVDSGFNIVSLSADIDETVFKSSSAELPWTDRYCDFYGTNGVNFKNYAVIGTPTMYILDKGGTIISKIATIDELLTQLKNL